MKRKKLLLLLVLAALLCPVAVVLAQREKGGSKPRYMQQGIPVDWEPTPEPEKIVKSYSSPEPYCFDSIRYWVGHGSKRAGLVLWMDQVRVIGFRFDGEATGFDMLRTLAAEDPRFQVAVHSGAILMMGWDVNENGNLGMSAEGKGIGAQSPYPGVIYWNSYTLKNVRPSEPEDYCWGAWMGNYWRYSVKDPGKPMGMANVGAYTRKLQDGSWDEWTGSGLRGDRDMLYIDKPIDFSKLQPEFDYCGVHYEAIGKPYMKEVRAVGPAAGYSGPLNIGRAAKAGEYAYRVKEVADSAFMGSAITSLAIHDQINVGRYSFADCKQLRIGEIPARTCVIPAGLFAGSALDSVTYPNTHLNEVGDSAFLNTNLRSFDFNVSILHRIGNAAFKGTKLTQITLPAVKVEIGNEAFATPTLTSVTSQIYSPAPIPDNAFSAETYANAVLTVPLAATAEYRKTAGWKNFAHIVEDGSIEPQIGGVAVVDGVWYYVSEDGVRVTTCTQEADGSMSGAGYEGKIVIPESVKIGSRQHEVLDINEKAFLNSKVTEIEIPQSIDAIYRNTFRDSKLLKSVKAPGVKSIAANAFDGCRALESLTLAPGANNVGDYAFRGCKALKSYPDTLNEIYNNAFENSGLQTVSLGKTRYTSLKYNQFLNCSSLNTVFLADDMEALTSGMFAGCAIEHLDFPASMLTIRDSTFARNPLHKVDLKNVRTVGAAAFMDCPLDTIVISGATVPDIKANTFSDSVFNNAVVVVGPGNATGYREHAVWSKFHHIIESEDIIPGAGSIVYRDGLYFLVKNDKEVWFAQPPVGGVPYSGKIVVPDSVNLGKGHWCRVTGMERFYTYGTTGRPESFVADTLILPATIKYMFNLDHIYSLKHLEIKSVDTWDVPTSLDYLMNLTSLQLGDSVRNMGNINCPSLKSFRVSDSLLTLGDINAPLLTSISGKAPLLDKLMSFNYCRSIESVDSIEFLPVLLNRIEIIPSRCFRTTLIDSVYSASAVEVGERAFADMPRLRAVSLPKVTTFGKQVFNGDTSLLRVYAPNVTTIGEECFYGTRKVKELSFPALTTASRYAFQSVGGLESLYLPSLKMIPQCMVTGAKGLKSFIIGPGVESIEYHPILGPESLELWHCPARPVTAGAKAGYLSPSIGVNPVIWVAPGMKETFKAHASYADCDIREVGVKNVTFGADIVSTTTLNEAIISAKGHVEVVDSMAGRVPELFLNSMGGSALMNIRPQVEYRLKGDASVWKTSAKLDGMNVTVRLSGLEDGKTYEYRWVCSRDTAVNTPWREFSTKVWADNIDYTDGTLWLNEDWYGADNGTVNFFDSTGMVYPRSYRHANKDHKFGVTSQYGTLFGGRMYVVSKQAGDNGGILTVADARTLRRIASTSDFGGADGRAFCGATSEKGYVSTSDGIYVVALDSLRVLGRIGGTSTGADLYSGQVGDMVCLGGKLYAAAQDKGVLVIDTETDRVTDTIPMPDILGVFTTRTGSLYAMTSDKSVIFKGINTHTLTTTDYTWQQGNFSMNFDWGSWRHIPVMIDPNPEYEEAIYFVRTSTRSNGAQQYSLATYDFSTKQTGAKIFYDENRVLYNLYGSPLACEPGNPDIMYVMACKGQQIKGDPGSWDYRKWYRLRYDLNTGAITELPLPEYYWFPAMALNRDHADPTLDSIASTPLRLDSADRSLTIRLNGADADAMPWQLSYAAATSDPGVLTARTEGDMLTLTAMPGVRRKQQAEVTVKAISNGKTAERRFTVTMEQRPDSVPTPLVDCHDRFPVSTHVTMSCADPYAAIYYTTDGTDPTLESARYSETFRLAESCTLKVAAYDDGVWSPIATRTLVVDPTGVDGIFLDGNLLTVPEGAEVFTAAGLRIPAGRMEKGIYIIVYKGDTLKIEVK